MLRAHDEAAASALEVPPASLTRLTPGVRLGSYEVLAEIGAGGMGQVYRTRDTRLRREVAIKVLPPIFTTDPERRARFEREARVLAALNHPNIAAIHGVEEGPAEAGHYVRALILELVEGRRWPSGCRMSGGCRRAEGTAREADPPGMLAGTPAYMSPEQACGQAVDKRTDIWAFGCLLYEMLTGKQAFAGEDIPDTLALVLTKEPHWDAPPSDAPPLIGHLLQRCLKKDRQKRIADISTALFAIDEAKAVGTALSPGPEAAHAGPPYVRSARLWRRLATFSAPALVAGLALAGGVWLAIRPDPPRALRLAITTTPATALTISGIDRDLVITPDGSRVVYAGNDGRESFVRPLDALERTSLFTGTPRAPFVSPDGEWVGFTDGATVLKKVTITGGPPVPIAATDGATRGVAWAPDDMIVFATNAPATGLQQVAAAGGPTTVLTKPDRTCLTEVVSKCSISAWRSRPSRSIWTRTTSFRAPRSRASRSRR